MLNNFVEKLFKNLNHSNITPGCVIASPTKNNPNYFYHWIRDSALTTLTLSKMYKKNIEKTFIKNFLLKYSLFEKHLQEINNLGEPKFNVDGTNFMDDWGRPQNDGPAIRIISCYEISKIYEDNKLFVRNYLYDGKLPSNTIIKKDLEYICNNYNKPCFDLWEETYGFHFYTSYMQLIAMKIGIKLATSFGDFYASEYYFKIYQEIKSFIKNFYINNQIYSNLSPDLKPLRKHDTSLILLLTQPKFKYVEKLYYDEIYKKNINEMIHHFEKKYKAKYWIGRYYDDKYYNGNPWILLTASLGQYYKIIGENDKYNDIKHLIETFYKNHKNLAEQININDMKPLSANHLSWSYCETIKLYL